MIRFRSLMALCGALALVACEKNAVQDITGTLPESRVRFFNFGIGSPQVHFFANDAKITATTSATGVESTVGIAYGNAASGGLYSRLDPGAYAFSGRIMATVDKNLPISNVPGTLESGKAYSVYQSGIYNTTTKQVDGFMVEDPIPATIDPTLTYVRFVNAIFNASALRLFATAQVGGTGEVPVGDAVAYKGAGAFVSLPPGLYNLAVRATGSTTNAISRVNVTFAAGRVYTIGARGDITVTTTTAAAFPFLDNTANR